MTISSTTPDPREPPALLRPELDTGPHGLSVREAERRRAVFGPNEVRRRRSGSLLGDVMRQLVHPLALLSWVAGALAFVAGTPVLGVAIVAVIIVNAAFALLQERWCSR